jgi:hypothetical protein
MEFPGTVSRSWRPIGWFSSGLILGGICTAIAVGDLVCGAILGGLIGGLIGILAAFGKWWGPHHPGRRLVGAMLSSVVYFVFIMNLIGRWLGTHQFPPNQNAMVVTWLITLVWITVALFIAVDAVVWMIIGAFGSRNDPSA